MSDPIYKPSLLCRLIGHKWWLRTSKEDTLIEGGDILTHSRWDEMETCVRCGIPNPRPPKPDIKSFINRNTKGNQ